jgi:dTDP-4-amino-4,6-dideoxygalactose transaminase
MRLDRQFAAHREMFAAAMLPVLESGAVLQGPAVAEFEHALARKVGLDHAVSCGSGTDALILGLKALGLPEQSRIAVPALTFVATGSPILHARCVPVFVDCNPETGLADEAILLDLIARRAVEAVIVVHLYGQLMDLDRISAAAKQTGVVLIEDAAQALGAMRNGASFGRKAHLSIVSFDPMKVVGAFGSGGAVLTNDAELAGRVRQLRYHGQDASGRYVLPGFNSQLPTVQAAALGVKLELMEQWQSRRAEIAAIFDCKLCQAPGARRMRTLSGNVHNWHKYVLWVDRRDPLRSKLQLARIQTKIHYERPLHWCDLFAAYADGVRCPNAEATAAHVLSLPMYPELTNEEAERIADVTRAALESLD